MTPLRLVTALVAAATTLALAPTAHADIRHQPSSDADHWVIETLAGDGNRRYVWDQPANPGRPTLAWELHGGLHQRWTIGAGIIKSVASGWCATAIDGRVHGRDCDGSSAQRWSFREVASGVNFIVNEAAGTCATFAGNERQLILLRCENRPDHLWALRPNW